MRLIDADKFNAKIADEYHGSFSDAVIHPYQASAMVDEQPTVRAVPVIRCKNCVWLVKKLPGPYDPGGLYCSRWTTRDGSGDIRYFYVGADWFCAGGEERDNEAD